MKSITLSVKDFATPIYPKGDLRRDGSLLVAPELGVVLHARIQARLERDGGYQSEVSLRGAWRRGPVKFKIKGRADGLFTAAPDGEPLIEEIKSTFAASHLLEQLAADDEHPYILQTLTYAHLYHLKYGDAPKARLRVVCLRTMAETIYELTYDPVAYRRWLKGKLAVLLAAIKRQMALVVRRKKLGVKIAFPFPQKRIGQQELIDDAAMVLARDGQMMIQAPTGIGKTLGLLFPALRHALRRGHSLIYLTPKNSQFQVVHDAVKLFAREGVRVKTLFLTARSKMCLADEVVCDPEVCPYAKGYYDKLRPLLRNPQMMGQHLLERGQLKEWGELWHVCPYALGMEFVDKADLVVCDYNYVFSPDASLASLSGSGEGDAPKKHTLLIDEAHNLYSRCMEYYSPALPVSLLKEVSERPFTASQPLRDEFLQMIDFGLALLAGQRPARGGTAKVDLDPEPFMRLYQQLEAYLPAYARAVGSMGPEDPVWLLFQAFSHFAQVLTVCGTESQTVYITAKDGEESLKIICCDPSKYIQPILGGFDGVIAFSATLSPFEFYRKLSGFADDCLFKEFPTAFPDANRKVVIIPQVSTAYRDRSANYRKIAEGILKIARLQFGHYVIFCPSFAFARALQPLLEQDDFDLHTQTPRMHPDEAAKLAAHWLDPVRNSLTLAVQGGSLAEGIDIDTPHLCGAFVVGPALPNYEFERELLRAYYEKEFSAGFAYAYVYPAMAKSIQAAGRIIRSETKRGLIVLMDRRFLLEEFTRPMPSYWYRSSPGELAIQGILQSIAAFWASPGQA